MPEGEWTFSTLKEHFDALRCDDQRSIDRALADAKEAVRMALDAADKAAAEARAATDKRLEGMNEFRATVDDQAKAAKEQQSNFVRREEFTTSSRAIEAQLLSIKSDLQIAQGRRESLGSAGQNIYYIVIIAGVIGSLLLGLWNIMRGPAPTVPAPEVVYVQPAIASIPPTPAK